MTTNLSSKTAFLDDGRQEASSTLMVPPLQAERLAGGYGKLTVFRDVSLEVAHGEVVGIQGPNGAGKTTLLKTIQGLLPAHDGRILLDGDPVGGLPAFQRTRRGMALVPEGRQILTELSVSENLELSKAAGIDSETYDRGLAEVHRLFPRLHERAEQAGGSLSGGEQQMLAIGRAMLLAPRVLMLDEPTQGLAPVVVRQVLEALLTLKGRYAIVVVEQNTSFLSELADRRFSMSGGRLTTYIH